MYENRSELLSEIAALEDTYFEFKEVVFKGKQVRFANEEGLAEKVIAEVFMSMANTEGGVVLFGVNKFGERSGIDEDKRDLLEQFAVNCALNNCEPKGSLEPILNWRYLPDNDGKERLVLQVDLARSRFYVHQTSDGKYLKRVGSHRTPIPAEQLGRLLAAKNLLITFEERPCPRTSLDNFNRGSFDSYYQRRFNRSYIESGLLLEKLLTNLKLAVEMDDGDWKLSNLGILLFSDSPHNWLPGAYVEIAVYDHDIADGNTKDSKRFVGPVQKQINDVIAYFRNSPYLAVSSEKSGSGRIDLPAYSPLALQEAVVNAVVHRDYELTGAQIIITVFPDRIELKNPGSLHNTLKPEDLYAGCQPVRRNQYMAGFFRDFPGPITGHSFMEARGEGFLNLIRESEKISGKRPVFEVPGQAVKLTIFAGDAAYDNS